MLNDHCLILFQLHKAEEHLWITRWVWPRHKSEWHDPITETIDKRITIERQMLDLGGEKCGALSQASLSVLGTVTIGERRCITQAVEPQDFKDGAVLIKEGEPRDALFIVVEGQVSFTQRRHHRYEVGPARAALGAPQRASARHASAPVLRPARLAVHCTPRAPGAYLAHLHHRPGPDEPEPVVKSDSLLTNQPCECTLTAVGPVKVLVLHGARQRLADYRAEEADREIREPSTAPLPLEAHTYFEYDRGETNVRHTHEILKKIMKMTARSWTSEHEIRMPDAAFAKVPVQDDDALTGWEQSVDHACDAPPAPATVAQLRKRPTRAPQ